jgi:DNA-directed RNA polymerase III subunit RPC1
MTINSNIESSLKSSYEELDPQKVYIVFSRIRDEDVILFDMDLNLCKPTDVLITHIPVPPVPIRPSVAVSASTTNEDDLTVKIAEIIQLNKLIKISIEEGVAPNKLIENWLLL